MFNKRTLYFKKKWIDADSEEFKIVSDSSLTAAILKKANYYELDIKKIHLNDFYFCKIVLRGNKKLFLNFVESLLDDFEKYIEDISF